MCPEKGRKSVRKIQAHTDTPREFELGDTAADKQRRREEREQRERTEGEGGGGKETKEGGKDRVEDRSVATPQSQIIIRIIMTIFI